MSGVGLLADYAEEFLTRIRRNPGRFSFYVMGTAISVGIFTYSTIVASSSATAVANDFDELAATLIEIQAPTGIGATPYTQVHVAQLEAIGQIEGVVGSVTVIEEDATLSSLSSPWRALDSNTPYVSIAGDLSLLDLTIEGAESGLLVGTGLVSRQGFRPGDVIEVGGTPVQISGVVNESPLVPQVLVSFAQVATDHVPLLSGRLLVRTRRGEIGDVAAELPVLLNPTNPGSVFVQYDPEAVNLRTIVVSRVDTFTVAIAAAVLAANTLAVGVSVFSAVIEQTRQLGLRRAIGATRRSLVFDVVAEVTGAGAFGAGLGLALGSVVALAGLEARGIDHVVPTLLLMFGVGVGIAAAMCAAIAPAIRAAAIQPIEALRGGQ